MFEKEPVWGCFMMSPCKTASWFEKEPVYGVGHRIVMIAMLWDVSAFLFEGLRSFWKATLRASTRDYDLVFWLLLAKTSHVHNMTIFHKATSGVNSRGASVQVFVFHAWFILVFSKIDFDFPCKSYFTSIYMKAINCGK